MIKPISLEQLNSETRANFVVAIGSVFEHSPWLAEAAASKRPFDSLLALYISLSAVLTRASGERQLGVIKAHPDLAGKAARAGRLTSDSMAEQASAGLDRLSEEEYTRFHRLNESYKKKFGFPFIICARRHTKDSILRQLDRRLKATVELERDAAMKEILFIAALRLDQSVRAHDRLNVNGRLTTHVLDNFRGQPAKGITVELFEVSNAEPRQLIVRAVTNADGRPDAPLIADRPVPIGQYELRFAVGDYYARANAVSTDPPFLAVVPVRFSIAEPEGHYHVPLLCTPWGYTTYRGS
jgi:2-oxo-4-hydroxy-4-carboxy-5-ureidoimidazoline decarboxylase